MRRISRIVTVTLIVLALTLSTSTVSYAKQEPPSTSIAVSVNGLSCATPAGTGAFSVGAFSFGATQTGTTSGGGGGGAGKASVSELRVTKEFNECSPALFGGVVTGRHFPSARLVHSDANGNPVLTIDLTDVFISGFEISGAAGPNVPAESVSFGFRKVCITEAGTNTKLCYDAATNSVS
jgi:type VI secretion system secreted protein Hcp